MNRKVYTDRATFEEQNQLLKTELPFSEDIGILKENVIIGSHSAKTVLFVKLWKDVTENPTVHPTS